MYKYLNLVSDILAHGERRENRTGVATFGVFGEQLRIPLRDGFPLLTTKKMFFRGVVEELLFFLRGETDTKILESKGISIWSGNTSVKFLRAKGLPYPAGEMGPGYGYQWRNFGGEYFYDQMPRISLGASRVMKTWDGVDQLQQVVDSIRNNPNDRRMIVSAWNPTQLHQMALPPCHLLFQFYVNKGRLSCQFYMRSVDVALGLPFNIASYALLTHIIANITDLEVGDLIFTGGDVHIYENHIDGMKEQLERRPFPSPLLFINKKLSSLADLESFSFEDIELKNYKYHPAIKMDMVV